MRRGGLVTDGPFAETKEHLGGFIVLEVPDLETAIEVASGWPGLDWAGDGVELRPVRRLRWRRGDHARLTPVRVRLLP